MAACPLAQGQEILNTFGELGNSELVSKYGFALPNNPFSNVHLRKNDLLSESRKILVEEQYQDRISYLEDQRQEFFSLQIGMYEYIATSADFDWKFPLQVQASFMIHIYTKKDWFIDQNIFTVSLSTSAFSKPCETFHVLLLSLCRWRFKWHREKDIRISSLIIVCLYLPIILW